MATIPQKTLRNDSAEILRRAEAGERFTITVSGRPAAELGPVRGREWVSGDALTRVWSTPAPQTLDADLRRMGATLGDPFAR